MEAPKELGPLLVTVDDLPLSELHGAAEERAELTDAMLAALARRKIHAVGLVTWKRAQPGDEALLERWLAAGHELGNHSTSHLHYSETPSDRYIEDVEAARVRLAALLERRQAKPRFFRFPFLEEGDSEAKLAAMRDYLARSGQRNLVATLDTQDWSFERPWVEARRAGDRAAMQRVAERYQADLRSDIAAQQRLGDEILGRRAPAILLLHAGEVGAAQWDELFAWLARQGYRFAAADEVLADPAFAEPPRYVAGDGPGLWDRLLALRRADKAKTEIAALLEAQAGAWTRGDLDGFVSAYAEDASFAAPSGLTRGKSEVLERYRKRYGAEPSTMGALTLDIVELSLAQGNEYTRTGAAVGSRVHGASVLARWRLVWGADPQHPDKEKSGLTLLYFERRGGAWKIAHDASM